MVARLHTRLIPRLIALPSFRVSTDRELIDSRRSPDALWPLGFGDELLLGAPGGVVAQADLGLVTGGKAGEVALGSRPRSSIGWRRR